MKTNTKKILIGINIIIYIFVVFVGSGCIEINEKSITGSYSDGANETLDLRDDSTFLFTLRVGYIVGRPVNQSSAGTFIVDGGVVTFAGSNGVTTLGHVQNGAILIEGTKFEKTE